MKYPYARYEHENRDEEERCIGEFRQIIQNQRNGGAEVGAIIVEPISSCCNQIATPEFFKSIRKIAQAEGIPFIVDETKTGVGSSGKYWAHQHWHLPSERAPDYVTFGGKSGLAGFYATEAHKLNDEATSFEDGLDLARVVQYGQLYKVAEAQHVLYYA